MESKFSKLSSSSKFHKSNLIKSSVNKIINFMKKFLTIYSNIVNANIANYCKIITIMINSRLFVKLVFNRIFHHKSLENKTHNKLIITLQNKYQEKNIKISNRDKEPIIIFINKIKKILLISFDNKIIHSLDAIIFTIISNIELLTIKVDSLRAIFDTKIKLS